MTSHNKTYVNKKDPQDLRFPKLLSNNCEKRAIEQTLNSAHHESPK